MNIDLDGNFWFNLSLMEDTINVFDGLCLQSQVTKVRAFPFIVVQEVLIFEKDKT